MEDNLSYIEPSQQLRQDFWEYVNRESRSSIISSSEFDPERDIESDAIEGIHSPKQILHEFPNKIKHRNLNLNAHRNKLSIKLNRKHSSNIWCRRANSNESIASNSSIETPHQTDPFDEETMQKFFGKLAVPTMENNSSNISNISSSILTNIKIFDFIPNKPTVIQASKDIWININPTDTTIDVIDAAITYLSNNDINLHGNKPEQYQLKYYSEEDDEICDYLPALKRNDIVASKNVDTIAMVYNLNYYEYKIYHTINNVKSECMLGIESDRIHIDNHFNYVFNLESKNDSWIDKKILMNKNEQKGEENNQLEIESCLDISILSSDKTTFEMTFLLECSKKNSSIEINNNPTSIRSSVSSFDFIRIKSYKPDNYDEMWNPKEIIQDLKLKNESCRVRYSVRSSTLCYEIVQKIKHLISECD